LNALSPSKSNPDECPYRGLPSLQRQDELYRRRLFVLPLVPAPANTFQSWQSFHYLQELFNEL
jgi:hypothetical protein